MNTKILVIPDVHLKPWMFEKAGEIMEERKVDQAVCLGDLADDWGKQAYFALYRKTYDAAIEFAKKYPETLWCYGNHDISYVWQLPESGYSPYCESVVQEQVGKLRRLPNNDDRIGFVHRIGKTLFSHGGVAKSFIDRHFLTSEKNNTDIVVNAINAMSCRDLWTADSPLWLRPQNGNIEMFYNMNIEFQVVGHTPRHEIERTDNFLSCDVFSTSPSGIPYGTQEFLIVDPDTFEWCGVK